MTDLGPGPIESWLLRDRIIGKRLLQLQGALQCMRDGKRCHVYCISKGLARRFEADLDQLCAEAGLQDHRHLITVHAR